MTAKKRTLAERLVDVEAYAERALGNYNEAAERGKPAHVAERYLATSQRWLDIANDLQDRLFRGGR